MDGIWNLEVMTPFGKHPATLRFERTGGTLTGNINSQMGDVPLSDIKVVGQSFDAAASYNFQGRTFSARVSGLIDGDQLDGTIKVAMPIAPTVRFTGTRAAR